MTATPNLMLPEFGTKGVPSGADLTDAMRRLDAVVQLSVLDFTSSPPTSPDLGDRYIVQAPATGGFAGHELQVAVYTQAGWIFFVPRNGWQTVVGAHAFYVFDETVPTWVTIDIDFYSPANTKGDILVYEIGGLARQAVGSDSQVLTADSTQTKGVKWAAPGGLTTKGDLMAYTGSIATRQAVGADGQVLTADSTQANGMRYASPASSAATTKGDLLVHTGAALVAQAIGTDGQVLTVDSTQTNGLKWAAGGGGSVAGTAASGCALTNSSNQSPLTSTNLALTWDTESYDTDGYHSGTNPTRIVIPFMGRYLFFCDILWDSNTSGRRIAFFQKNGAVATSSVDVRGAVNATEQVIATVLDLAAGDYVELVVFQDSGGTRTVSSTRTNFGCVFQQVPAPQNVTPDTHPGTANIADDEFESGSTIDLTGARRSGATAWSWLNQGTLVSVVSQGALRIANTNQTASLRGVTQAPSGSTYKYRAKVTTFMAANNVGAVGLILGKSGKFIEIGLGFNSGGFYFIQKWTNATTSASTSFGTVGDIPAVRNNNTGNGVILLSGYLEIEYDGTNVIFRTSGSGYDGTFSNFLSETAATFLGGAPDAIGLVINGSATATAFSLISDWFRKVA